MIKGPFINIRNILFSLFIIIILVFGYSRFYNFKLGPRISIESPKQNELLTTPLLEINGSVARINKLKLNNQKIFANPDNTFKEILLLQPGYNILTLEASDVFGRIIREKREVFYQDKSEAYQDLPTKADLEAIKEKKLKRLEKLEKELFN